MDESGRARPHTLGPPFRNQVIARLWLSASAMRLGPPATDDEITFMEALLGRTPPADLLAWWRRSSGTSGSDRLLLMPRSTPYTIDQAMDSRKVMLEIAAASSGENVTWLIAAPAGSPCTLWLPIAPQVDAPRGNLIS
ncbi:hypothetical protein [Actinomadura sp. 6N118]|uniref:hypothetical protein n=1 Tax=Actinomadura sp. 6N118 TaxID=3375151 RepID=UPI00379A151F